MPARKPQTPRPRDQIVARETTSNTGKERMIAETARVVASVDQRLAKLDSRPEVTGSRSSGEALQSLLSALVALGLITDRTTV